jgi:hypothetical protein
MFKHAIFLQTAHSQYNTIDAAVWFRLAHGAKQLIYNNLTKFLFGLFGVFPNKPNRAN